MTDVSIKPSSEDTASLSEPLPDHIDPADLARVAVPVLVVAGERDAVRPEHTRLIADRLPHARLAVVPRAGHMLPLTHPRELAALVETFLAPGQG